MTTDKKPYVDPFPSPLGSIVFYRTYSDKLTNGDGSITMQTWEENAARNADFLSELGELTPEQRDDIYTQQSALTVTPPGRVLWAAKTNWINKPGKANYLSLFNCVGIRPTSWKWLGLNFLLLMMGCGVGAVIEEEVVSMLPPINSKLPKVVIKSMPGDYPYRPEDTTYELGGGILTLHVGDSKEGWVDSYVALLVTCSDPFMEGLSCINVELGGVRPNGQPIKGFGGTSNPIALPGLYEAVMKILALAAGRQITAYEACLLLNEAAKTTVAGNIRRSARWDGYSYGSPTMTGAKDNLWSQNPVTGKWSIDPDKDALRMANISAITHTKPTLEECMTSVQKQYDTGEGALWYAPAAIKRTNVDILPTEEEQWAFEHAYTTLGRETGRAYLRGKLHDAGITGADAEKELDHRMMRYGANPCCLTGDTMVLTRGSVYTIEDLLGKEVDVWDGEQWTPTTFQVTGTNQEVFEVLLEDGSSITATSYHKFILSDGTTLPLEELKVGNRLLAVPTKYNTYNDELALIDYPNEVGTGSANKDVVSIISKGISDKVYCCYVPTNNRFTLANGVLSSNCEILGKNFVCSLSQVDLSRFNVASPTLWEDIDKALETAALIVCALLKRGFDIPELQESREVDPIVAVTLNGVFDFLVNLYGEPWLRWWMAGCPEYWQDPMAEEDGYVATTYGGWHSQEFIEDTAWMLNKFRDRVQDTVTAYCTKHNLRVPNRYTAMQPSGSKSCLTGGTPACYTPKAAYWIRRVTLGREHPVALAALDYGYSVVPSSSCKDEDGVLLDNPYDERVTEWMVEVPDQCTWSSNVEGEYDVAQAPITSQWYLTMACQQHYVTHNTSVTFELNGDEVPVLAGLIHEEIQSGGNYVSAAIFARDKGTMPRMPYEPITREVYTSMMEEAAGRRKSPSPSPTRTVEEDVPIESDNFKELVEKYYNQNMGAESGPIVGCDGDSCTIPEVPTSISQ